MSILDNEKPMDAPSMPQGSPTSFWNGNPKTMFYMGLILGVAVSAVLALLLLLGLIFSGKSLSAAGTQQQVAVAPSPSPSPSAEIGRAHV